MKKKSFQKQTKNGCWNDIMSVQVIWKIPQEDDSNLQRALCMSSSHSNAMLQNQHQHQRKDDQFKPKSIWLHDQVEAVAIGSWWWVVIQWEDCVLQLKSDWKLSTSVPAVKTFAWDFSEEEVGGKERTIKETDRAERARLRLTLCF